MQPPETWMPPQIAFSSWGELITILILAAILILLLALWFRPDYPKEHRTTALLLVFILLIIFVIIFCGMIFIGIPMMP
ncbi:MAG: hypothetical protein ACFE9D_03365 [Promethearchaeota archaeon]